MQSPSSGLCWGAHEGRDNFDRSSSPLQTEGQHEPLSPSWWPNSETSLGVAHLPGSLNAGCVQKPLPSSRALRQKTEAKTRTKAKAKAKAKAKSRKQKERKQRRIRPSPPACPSFLPFFLFSLSSFFPSPFDCCFHLTFPCPFFSSLPLPSLAFSSSFVWPPLNLSSLSLFHILWEVKLLQGGDQRKERGNQVKGISMKLFNEMLLSWWRDAFSFTCCLCSELQEWFSTWISKILLQRARGIWRMGEAKNR